jgi:hypothetical protein
MILKTFGMKKMKELSKDEILKQGSKYNIPENDSYELDSSYVDFLFSLDSIKFKKEQKNHFQPLQALYYDQTGQLKSFHINCNAGGFPNLKWNRFETFDEFIPKQQTPLDSILPLQKHLNYLVPLNDKSTIEFNEYDFVVLVHWSRFMGRQSKRLIKIVQENAAQNKNYRIKIIYLNNDNIFANTEEF